MIAQVKSEADNAVKAAQQEAKAARNALAAKERELADRESSIRASLDEAVGAERTRIAKEERERAETQAQTLIALERDRAKDRETKMERLYSYMTGSDFRATLEGIALPFCELQDELAAEKRAAQARWKRHERRIERVLVSVGSLQGDLQGIAGEEMPALSGFQADGLVEIPDMREESDALLN
jgi:hypothetical protein